MARFARGDSDSASKSTRMGVQAGTHGRFDEQTITELEPIATAEAKEVDVVKPAREKATLSRHTSRIVASPEVAPFEIYSGFPSDASSNKPGNFFTSCVDACFSRWLQTHNAELPAVQRGLIRPR